MYKYKDSLTKIIATIGPSCNNKETIRKMILEGLDVCRLNFSHGSHADHEKIIHIIKDLNKELKTNVPVMADLQGPKLRIGEVQNNGVELKPGNTIQFVTFKCLGTAEKVYMSYQPFPMDVNPGETVLVDDGKLKLEVLDTNRKDTVDLKIINGGILSSKKGVNLPNTKISLPSLTDKDLKDMEFILDQNISWIALSFVRTASDIITLKEIIEKKGITTKVIAKIEKPEAIDAIDDIIDVSDGIMVARGDLGVETPFNKVTILQKQIIHKCINKSTPVIIATQMMESMITNFLPTRAEVSDVSNAVLDGADAVMLSGETSVGKYPVEAITNMDKVINSTELSGFYLNHEHPPDKNSSTYLSDSICYDACKMATLTEATGIVIFTASGGSAYKIASHRPGARIFVFTMDARVLRELSLIRGVQAFHIAEKVNVNNAINHAIEVLKETELIREKEILIFVGGIPMNKREPVNMIKVAVV